MSNRFSPEWSTVKKVIEPLIRYLAGNESLFVNAFTECSTLKANNAAEVKNNLQAIVSGRGIPWGLFNTLSATIKQFPLPLREPIAQLCLMPTGHQFEKLRLHVDGHWQVVWELDETLDDDDRFIALDWYEPPDVSKAPVVPLAIVDYVAGSTALLRDDLVLPAAALLLSALESALWEELSQRGISRESERVSYQSVQWQFKRVGPKLVITIVGADKNIEDIDSLLSDSVPPHSFELRKKFGGNGKSTLEFDIADGFVEILASETVVAKSSAPEKGLLEAIERSRAEGILRNVPSPYDATIHKLRNNLIHLPSGGILNPRVPEPGGGEYETLDDLRAEPQLIRNLAHTITRLINELYRASASQNS